MCVLGSEGKIVIASQRVGVLSGIGVMADAAITRQSGQDVVTYVIESFISVVKQEGKTEICGCSHATQIT